MKDEQESGGITAVAEAEPEAPASTQLVAVADNPQAMTEEEQKAIAALAGEVGTVVETAKAIEVRTVEEAGQATEFLSQIKGKTNQSEAARKAIVKPLRDHVKFINDTFKQTTGPLAEADGIVREKVLAFNREVEETRAQEQARLDRERAQREEEERERQRAAAAAAAQERERAAREAAKAEADAKRAREAAAKADAEEVSKLDAEMREKTPEELDSEQRLSRNEKRKQAATRELERRAALAAEAEAAERAEQARAAEAAAREAEEAAKAAPPADVPNVEVAATGPLRSPSGSASTRKRWTFEVEDPTKLPAEYLIPNDKAIREAVRQGERSIPGVRIFQDTELAVRAS